MEQKTAVSFGHYVVVIRRQWKTILVLSVIGVLVGFAYLQLSPVRVTASTLVNVNVIVADPFSPIKAGSALLDASTETQLVTSYAVAKAAEAAFPQGDDVKTLREGIAVTTSANATTLKIAYTSSSPQLARSGADAIANAYIGYRQNQAQTKKLKLQSQLNEQLASLTKGLTETSLTQESALISQIGSVRSQLNTLSLIDTDGGTVLTPASENPVILKPQASIVLATGLLGGLAMGLVVAFIINVLDRRVRDWYDIRGAGAGPVLAKLVSPTASIPATGIDLDSFRVVRELLLANVRQQIRVLTVIDKSHSSPSDVAANLAVSLAQSGTHVCLVVMGISDENMNLVTKGLQLSNSKPPHSTGKSPVFESLRVKTLTVLRPEQNTSGAVADDFVTELVRAEIIGQRSGGVLVLSLPPDAPHASRLAAGRLSDAVLLVAECMKTRIDELAMTAAEMSDIRTHLAGTVLTTPERVVADQEDQKKISRRQQRESVHQHT